MSETLLSKEQQRKEAILLELKKKELLIRLHSITRVQLLEQLHEIEFNEYKRALNV
jgi:hypothetical protein